MRNILRLFLSLVVAMAFTACSDRLDDYYTAEDLAGLRVHLQLPDYSKALVKTRAEDGNDENISSVTVIAYDRDGKFISPQQNLTLGTDGSITPSLPSGTATVAVVTNTKLTDEQCANLSSTYLSSPSATAPVCWGSASVNKLLKSTTPSISLLRMTAKVTVKKDDDLTDFTVEGIKMYKTASEGSIAPGDAAMTNGVVTYVTNKSDVAFNATSSDYKPASQVFYETPAGKAFLIVKGKYKDKEEGYYKVKLYKDAEKSNEELDLLRNHNYIVTINRVNEAGYSSEDEAVAGDAENRMTAIVVDDNPPIVDMISCKDYELGVCLPLTMDGKGDKKNATVVTSYQKEKSSNTYNYKITTDAPDWVTVGTAVSTTLPTTSDDGDGGKLSSKGTLDVIPITVAKNTTEKERTAKLTVTAGDLTRTITVKQAGYDFLADDNRKVTFLINGTPQSDNYFGKFLPKVQGVKAADNQGLVRDHGLHFAAVKGNTYSYKVPHLAGDKLTNTDSRISISDGGVGKYYTVTLANTANTNDDLWVSEFTITNKDKVTITYPVYHTGVFHHITSTDNQLGTAKTGWFYYGVVEVKGTSGSTYHLLDRNIGASSNGFYSPSTQETRENEGAKGAYLELTKTAHKESGVSDGKGITIYCKASSAPFLYAWDDNKKDLNGSWPGTEMQTTTLNGSPYYYKTFNDVSSINILFTNKNGSPKTGDITNITASSVYSYDNNTGYKKIIFPDVPNIGDSYMPFSSYFKVPTESYVDDILPKEVETRHTKTGEAYYCYAIPTTGASELQPKYVYLPVTGYYEGTSFRNENHANIWTSTRLSGFQGFSVSSPEFGFWFRYLDCHNSIEEITNMRFVNGSAGRYGTIYNAMPVRGIHKI